MIASLGDVGAVVLETDGSFSVIRDLGSSPTALRDVKVEQPTGSKPLENLHL
jgi:hypothetical protein